MDKDFINPLEKLNLKFIRPNEIRRIKLFGKPLTTDRIKNLYVLFQLRQGRGSSYTGEIYAIIRDSAIFTPMIYLINTHFGWSIPLWSSFVFFVVYFIGTYKLGEYDEKKLKIWQKQEEYQTKNINPYFKRLEEKIDKILEGKWQI